jgi:hypothetical protein
MNRRQFTTALSALAATPALPLKALTVAPVTATAIPNGARFWAIYMSQLHGTCSAKTLSTMTGLDISAAQGVLTRMIGDGIITPTRMISKAINTQANKTTKPSQWKDRVQKFVDEKKASATPPTTDEVENDVSDKATAEDIEKEAIK